MGVRWQDLDLEDRTLRVTQSVVIYKNKPVVQEPKSAAARRVGQALIGGDAGEIHPHHLADQMGVVAEQVGAAGRLRGRGHDGLLRWPAPGGAGNKYYENVATISCIVSGIIRVKALPAGPQGLYYEIVPLTKPVARPPRRGTFAET